MPVPRGEQFQLLNPDDYTGKLAGDPIPVATVEPRKAKQEGVSNEMKLFMTGREWRDSIARSSDWMGSDLDELWKQKAAEARAPKGSGVHGAGVYEALKAEGWNPSEGDVPPTLTFTDKLGASNKTLPVFLEQGEGHHRIAAAAELEEQGHPPIFIPTNYKDVTAGLTGEQDKKAARLEMVRQMEAEGRDMSAYRDIHGLGPK